MQRRIDTTTPLDLARPRVRHRARRVGSSGVTAVLLTFVVAGGAAATVTDDGAHCAGYEVGMPDGCWGPARVLGEVIDRTLVPTNVR